jgi:NAD(P)H dehydrogenase (quinone)
VTKICVNGASGQLGSLIVKELLDRLPARQITVTSRNVANLENEARLGVNVFEANYSDAASLDAAYAGCDALMLISGGEIYQRVEQHGNAVRAAEKAGLKHIVYTSVSGCHPMNPTPSSAEHWATEEMLVQSAANFTILRNHFYSELVIGMFRAALRSGEFHFPGETGLICPVSVKDIAACAATILCDPNAHKNVTYELTGPELLTLQDITHLMATIYDMPISYVPLPNKEMFAKFEERGIPFKGIPSMPLPHRYGSEEICTNYIAIKDLFHAVKTSHVERITGTAPRKLDDVIIDGRAHWQAIFDAE